MPKPRGRGGYLLAHFGQPRIPGRPMRTAVVALLASVAIPPSVRCPVRGAPSGAVDERQRVCITGPRAVAFVHRVTRFVATCRGGTCTPTDVDGGSLWPTRWMRPSS